MPHRKHKCTDTVYDYAIININTYISLMYELKKMERYLRVNLLGPGPRLIKKKKGIYRAAVLQRLRNTTLLHDPGQLPLYTAKQGGSTSPNIRRTPCATDTNHHT